MKLLEVFRSRFGAMDKQAAAENVQDVNKLSGRRKANRVEPRGILMANESEVTSIKVRNGK
jgi:hypothetical protein